ncbi:MAG: hypothetical protein Kow00120_20430 [Anaerolineae bacterium]
MRQWICEAIDSALVQAYPNIEIIVIDDGSTDGTAALLRARYGDRIRYAYQANRGRGAARNAGLRLARGAYIQFLDADDMLCPDKIAAQAEFLAENARYAVVYGVSHLFVDGNPGHTWPYPAARHYTSGDLLPLMVRHGGLFQLLPALVRREWVERVGGFDETMARCEDYDFWLRMAHAGAAFAYLPGAPVALYRKVPARLEGDAAEALAHTAGQLHALKKLAAALSADARRQLGIEDAMARAQYEHGCALLRNRRRREGVLTMRRCFKALDLRNRVHASVYMLFGRWLPYPWLAGGLAAFDRARHRLRLLARRESSRQPQGGA